MGKGIVGFLLGVLTILAASFAAVIGGMVTNQDFADDFLESIRKI